MALTREDGSSLRCSDWAGAQAGAAIGAFGGPVGVVVGAAVGALVASQGSGWLNDKSLAGLGGETMGVLEALVIMIGVFGCLMGSVLSFRMWRGDAAVTERTRGAFILALTSDPEKARAMVRGFPAVSSASWGAVISGTVAVLDEAGFGVVSDSPALQWFGVAGGIALLLAGVALDLVIIRYNRPRFLVPPCLRWEPGYGEVVAARGRGENLTEFYESFRVAYDQRR